MSPAAHLHRQTICLRHRLAALACFVAIALFSAGMATAQTAGTKATGAQAGAAPANAIIVGNGWRCRDGYALGDSGLCETVKAPPNAIVTGNRWVCMPGFRRDG